jgi:copper homeostasis protein
MSRLTLEVIATSVGDAVAAEHGGADRLELVVDLPRGGMTPPLALIDAVLDRVRIPVRVMVRETESHEVDDDAMRDRLISTATAIASRPIAGLVFGALRRGQIDLALTHEIGRAADGRPMTVHRAFDAASDQTRAIADLMLVPAVDRILTTGGGGEWTARAARLAAWARQGIPRLGILVGGGVVDEMLAAIAAVPGIREVHVGRAARTPGTDTAPVDAGRVAQLVDRLDAIGRTPHV